MNDKAVEFDISLFRQSLKDGGAFEKLFDLMPDIYFFAKNQDRRVIMTNQANLRLLGIARSEQLIGKTNFELFPPDIAEKIEADDKQILATGNPLINRVEMLVDEEGGISWYSTNKLPLFDYQDNVVGIMGTTKVLHDAEEALHPYRDIAPALVTIKEQFREAISVEELAEQCHLSSSQFRRRFNQHFRTSPTSFILRLRMQRARRMLTTTDRNIAEIAQQCGFSDQSHFTKQFKSLMNVSPRQYRSEMHESNGCAIHP